MNSSKLLSSQDQRVSVWGLMPVPKGAWLSFFFETGRVPSVEVQMNIVRDLPYLQFSRDGIHIQLIFADMKWVDGVCHVLLLKRQGQQENCWAVITDTNGVPLPIDPTLVTLQIWNGNLHVISVDTANGFKIIHDVTQRVKCDQTMAAVVHDMYSHSE